MPLASIHLFSLSDPKDLPSLLKHIASQPITPLTLAKPIRWIVKPTKLNTDPLLTIRWDLLLILETTPSSRTLLTSLLTTNTSKPTTSTNRAPFQITRHFTLSTGIPSRLLKSYNENTNPTLLHPPPSTQLPPLTSSLTSPILRPTSQTLALSPPLSSWIGSSPSTLPVSGAISMLNLLSFNPALKPSYLTYGTAFVESIGSQHGGVAKLVGSIVGGSTKAGDQVPGKWHEFALAHYPSLLHFKDMLASREYQEVNEKYRVPALWDTCILCTSESEVERLMAGDGRGVDMHMGGGAKL